MARGAPFSCLVRRFGVVWFVWLARLFFCVMVCYRAASGPLVVSGRFVCLEVEQSLPSSSRMAPRVLRPCASWSGAGGGKNGACLQPWKRRLWL